LLDGKWQAIGHHDDSLCVAGFIRHKSTVLSLDKSL